MKPDLRAALAAGQGIVTRPFRGFLVPVASEKAGSHLRLAAGADGNNSRCGEGLLG